MGWNEDAARLVEGHEAAVRPLEVDANRAWWEANTSGAGEAFEKKEAAQNRLDEILADTGCFAEIESLLASVPAGAANAAGVADPKRQLELMRLQRFEKQVPPALLREIAAKANAVEQAFNVYRPRVNGEEWTDSRVRETLRRSKDSVEREAAWKASKGVGAVVERDLLDLVRLRNDAARQRGFAHFQAMSLAAAEQDGAAIDRLFDELDLLTKDPYRKLKSDLDVEIATYCGIGVHELQPWHYHDAFFQEAPAISGADLDAPYRDTDVMALCSRYYEGIGLPVEDVLARSDLYERAGKSPHAFCTDIDRQGDVRVLANVVPTEYWMATMLHELGHAVYSSKNIPSEMPYVLRTEAHMLTTEGIAMLFQRFAKSGRWLKAMGVPVDVEAFEAAGARTRRRELLVFSRWCQVMYRFEKALYENPERDLRVLWWDLVMKYQGLRRPLDREEPDYAAKIHICSAPVYYHNYLMGELFASQVLSAMARSLQGKRKFAPEAAVGDRRVGEFLRARVFAPGKRLPWNELTRHATGSPLGADSFAGDFGG